MRIQVNREHLFTKEEVKETSRSARLDVLCIAPSGEGGVTEKYTIV